MKSVFSVHLYFLLTQRTYFNRLFNSLHFSRLPLDSTCSVILHKHTSVCSPADLSFPIPTVTVLDPKAWAPQGVFQAMCHTQSPVWQSGRCFNCWKRTSRFGHQLYTAHFHWGPCTRRQISYPDLPQRDGALQDFTNKRLRCPRAKTRAYQDFILLIKPVINNYPNQFSNYYSQVFGRAVIFSLPPWGLPLRPSLRAHLNSAVQELFCHQLSKATPL